MQLTETAEAQFNLSLSHQVRQNTQEHFEGRMNVHIIIVMSE
jgi:hypothetical protein